MFENIKNTPTVLEFHVNNKTALEPYIDRVVEMELALVKTQEDQSEYVKLYDFSKLDEFWVYEQLKHSNYYLLLSDNDIIGYMRVNHYNGMKGIYIEAFYIDDKYRGAKYGDFLMKWFMGRAKRLYTEATNITLGVISNNKPAIKLYSKYKFKTYHQSMVCKI